jgi:hypothetical protein
MNGCISVWGKDMGKLGHQTMEVFNEEESGGIEC